MSESDTDRAVVKTYVPAYQKTEWVEDADALDMSQSEYVRTMVQAGRRDFAVDPYPEHEDRVREDAGGDGGNTFRERVYELLREDTRTWDELLEAVTDDVEGRLEDALQDLQTQNRVVYSGRNGGYEAVEE